MSRRRRHHSRRRLLLAALALACPLLAVFVILPWVAARLAARTGSFSILNDIAKPFEAVAELGEEVVEGAEAAWNAITTVWRFLQHSGGVLDVAWDWVVHGVEWAARQGEQLADETYRTIAHLITHTLPELAEWVYRNSILWAWREIKKLARHVFAFIEHVIRWAQRELHRLYMLAAHWVHRLWRWAQHAVWWVEHRAGRVWFLLTHPDKLALMLAEHIIEPAFRWLMRKGAGLAVRLLKHEIARGSGLERFIEDVLHDML